MTRTLEDDKLCLKTSLSGKIKWCASTHYY